MKSAISATPIAGDGRFKRCRMDFLPFLEVPEHPITSLLLLQDLRGLF
jgi:hypothetical protein